MRSPVNTTYATQHMLVEASGKTAGRRKAGASAIRAVLLVLFLLSIYVEVPLYITESLFVPSFFTLLVLTPVLAVMYHRRIYKYEAAFVGQVLFLLVLTALLSPGFAYLDQKLLGLVQTMLSIIGGILLFKLLGDLPKRWVARILLALSVLLLAGAFLEVIGILRPISDAFREVAYSSSGYGVYDADERDLGITGFARPKLFTSEPSLLAIGFFAFVNSWLVLAYSKKTLAVTCLGTLLMFVMVGSPVIALSLAVSLAVVLFNEPRLSSLTFISGIICIIGLGLAFVNIEVFASFIERINESYRNIGTLSVSSENLRVVFPYITLRDILQNSPFFGIGISGKEVIERFSSLPLDPDIALGNNVLAMFFMYFGLVGSILFIGAILNYWRRAEVGRILLLVVLVLALSQMMGGFESPRLWGYTFLFAGVVAKSSVPSRPPQPIGNERFFRKGKR